MLWTEVTFDDQSDFDLRSSNITIDEELDWQEPVSVRPYLLNSQHFTAKIPPFPFP